MLHKPWNLVALAATVLLLTALVSCDSGPTTPTSGWYYKNTTASPVTIKIHYNYGTATSITLPANSLTESNLSYYGNFLFDVLGSDNSTVVLSKTLYIPSYNYSLVLVVWDGSSLTVVD